MPDKIRLFHRIINFNSTPRGRKKCEISLRHTLRILLSLSSTKQLEWDPKLSKNNLIHAAEQTQALVNLVDSEKWEKLFSAAPEPKIKNQSKLKTQRRQYKDKIKKAIEAEEKAGNIQVCEFLIRLLEEEGYVSRSRVDYFASLRMIRPKQRIKMLETYLNAHNQLCSRPQNENHTFIQEGVFKVPQKWNIGSDIISTHEYLAFTQQFLTDYYPNYNVELIVVHDDERLENETTGIHSHYFINGKNTITGEYDLRRRQIEIVNRYLLDNKLPDECLPEDGKMSYKQSKLLGHYYQRVVQDYANKYLLMPKGLEAEFSDETEKASEQYKNMVKQVKLPKSQRKFNFYSRQIESCNQLLKSKLAEIDKLGEEKQKASTLLKSAMENMNKLDDFCNRKYRELDRLDVQKSIVQDELNSMEMRYQTLESTFQHKYDELADVKKELECSEHSLKETNHEIERVRNVLKQVTNESKKLLEGIIESVFKLLFVKYKRNAEFVEKFTKELIKKVDEHIPEPLQPILKGVIKLSKEKEIFKDL